MVCEFANRDQFWRHNRQHNNVQTMRFLCFLGFCSVMSPGLLGQAQKKSLTVINQWVRLDFKYPSLTDRQQAMDDGSFVSGNGVPIDMDVYYGGNGMTKTFVTIPRFQTGIPATLTTVTKENIDGNPLLAPYPSWSWNSVGSCDRDRLVSVFRVQIDTCGRLWVLDTGKIESVQLCKPQIIAFDLATDQVVHRYEVPESQIRSTSILVTPVVDVRDPGTCMDTFVYVADVTGFGLIVYDVRQNLSWRITNKLMYPVPDYGTFTINRDSFDLMDGILGMALSPLNNRNPDRILFFHALASATENYVYTSVIRNHSLFLINEDPLPREFKVYSKKRPSQSAAEAMDKDGIMHFGLMRETSMACWNSRTEYDQRNIDVLERNVNTLQFPSGVKIVNNRKGTQELWVMTCRFQLVMTGTINSTNEINYRIQAVKVDDFLAGSKCKNAPPNIQFGSNGGGYGLVSQPQAAWAGGSTYGRNSSPKREVPISDRIIFMDN